MRSHYNPDSYSVDPKAALISALNRFLLSKAAAVNLRVLDTDYKAAIIKLAQTDLQVRRALKLLELANKPEIFENSEKINTLIYSVFSFNHGGLLSGFGWQKTSKMLCIMLASYLDNSIRFAEKLQVSHSFSHYCLQENSSGKLSQYKVPEFILRDKPSECHQNLDISGNRIAERFYRYDKVRAVGDNYRVDKKDVDLKDFRAELASPAFTEDALTAVVEKIDLIGDFQVDYSILIAKLKNLDVSSPLKTDIEKLGLRQPKDVLNIMLIVLASPDVRMVAELVADLISEKTIGDNGAVTTYLASRVVRGAWHGPGTLDYSIKSDVFLGQWQESLALQLDSIFPPKVYLRLESKVTIARALVVQLINAIDALESKAGLGSSGTIEQAISEKNGVSPLRAYSLTPTPVDATHVVADSGKQTVVAAGTTA